MVIQRGRQVITQVIRDVHPRVGMNTVSFSWESQQRRHQRHQTDSRKKRGVFISHLNWRGTKKILPFSAGSLFPFVVGVLPMITWGNKSVQNEWQLTPGGDDVFLCLGSSYYCTDEKRVSLESRGRERDTNRHKPRRGLYKDQKHHPKTGIEERENPEETNRSENRKDSTLGSCFTFLKWAWFLLLLILSWFLSWRCFFSCWRLCK